MHTKIEMSDKVKYLEMTFQHCNRLQGSTTKPPYLAYVPPYFVYRPPHFAYILRRLSYVLSLPFYLTTSTFLRVYIEALELQFTIKLLIQFLTTLQSLQITS